MEIKKAAKEGNKEACTLLAKQLIQVRKQKNRTYAANSKITSVGFQNKTIGANVALSNAMGTTSKTMGEMNKVILNLGTCLIHTTIGSKVYLIPYRYFIYNFMNNIFIRSWDPNKLPEIWGNSKRRTWEWKWPMKWVCIACSIKVLFKYNFHQLIFCEISFYCSKWNIGRHAWRIWRRRRNQWHC